jgi:YegS/Rv2252/BmrU family lipid kinase
MTFRFIFNPISGRNRRRPGFAQSLRAFVAQRARDADLAITEGPGHATELARDAVHAGARVVVAIGGDGTMNEVAQALVGTPTALALVPCGSGNGLALHLGLPRGALAALELATGATGRIAAIDTGVADGRPFFNAMGLGLDAEIARRFNGLARRGLPAYARVAFATLRELRAERCTLHDGGHVQTLDTLLVAVANSDQYGNHARIAPGARVDDGLLDLTVVRPTGLFGAAGVAWRLFAGRIGRSPHVVRRRAASFTIERAAAGIIHTDGEPHRAGTRIEVRVRPQSLRIVVPEGRRVRATPLGTAPLALEAS